MCVTCHKFKELTKEFGELTSFARVVLSANDTIPDEEAAATEAMAAKTQRWLLWQAVAVIPGAVLFFGHFYCPDFAARSARLIGPFMTLGPEILRGPSISQGHGIWIIWGNV